MKKIIFILFLFCLLYSCYYIYDITENKNTNILLIGDDIVNNPYLNNNAGVINKDFVNRDYRINDINDIITYNKELDIDNKTESIHRLLKEYDIVIISIGMNDIYYKLGDNTKEIYTFLNDMLNSYENILKEISRYDNHNIYILGYYNATYRYNDIFTYVNYKLNKMINKYGYNYIDLNKVLSNNEKYYLKKDNFVDLIY